jgi:hypothetical protein
VPNRQNQYIIIRTSKKNFTKLTPPFGLKKYAKQNTSHQTIRITVNGNNQKRHKTQKYDDKIPSKPRDKVLVQEEGYT